MQECNDCGRELTDRWVKVFGQNGCMGCSDRFGRRSADMHLRGIPPENDAVVWLGEEP